MEPVLGLEGVGQHDRVVLSSNVFLSYQPHPHGEKRYSGGWQMDGAHD
jgi:hypothetical protein